MPPTQYTLGIYSKTIAEANEAMYATCHYTMTSIYPTVTH